MIEYWESIKLMVFNVLMLIDISIFGRRKIGLNKQNFDLSKYIIDTHTNITSTKYLLILRYIFLAYNGSTRTYFLEYLNDLSFDTDTDLHKIHESII